MIRFGGLPAGKAIMKLIGIDCGPVRLPLRRFQVEDEAALRAALAAVGFFDFASKADV
jgi:N-acetylneuraminate lyase